MRLLKKIIHKIKQGMLREVITEFRWIYTYGLHYKGSIFWYIFLGVFGIATGLLSSVLSKYIIDAVTGSISMDIIPAAAAFVIMKLLVISVNAFTSQISAKIEIKVDQEIRAEVYDKILEADWEAMQQYHSGDLLNRLNSDVGTVSSSVISWIPNFITRVMQFAGAFVIILYYDPMLAALALLSAPVTAICSRTLAGRMHTYNKKMREVSSEMMAFESESLQNTQLLKSFGIIGMYGEKLRAAQGRFRDIKLEYKKFSVMTSYLMSVCATGISVICYCWGVYRLWSGHITYGTMTLFLQMASSLSGTFSALIQMVPQAISAATSAGRIMAVSELPKEKKIMEAEVEDLLNAKTGVSVIAREVDFQYCTGKKVLKDIEFCAAPGEIVALVGPSGEGKTTMLRILLGLVSVQRGCVFVNGTGNGLDIPVSAASRRLFSYVPQENILFAGTVAENLRMIKPDATEAEMDDVLRIACAYEFIHSDSLGLYRPVHEKGGGFSEGQIQRLAIARAMLSDAPILLLDEATSALDVATERKVLRNIMKYKQDCTCIVTTHRPSVLKLCDRIYQIADTEMKLMKEEEVEKLIIEF